MPHAARSPVRPWTPGAAVLLALALAGVGGNAVPAAGQGAVGALQGRVRDSVGAAVAGAYVRVVPVADTSAWRAAETDALGFWQLTGLEPGAYRVRALRLGYAPAQARVEVEGGESARVELVLETRAVEVEGVEVEAERSRERARFEEEAGATIRELEVEMVKAIPGVAEADPLRAVQVLPGVITTSDFSSAFNVRGGSADQNLILLDGTPIFNPTHLGGFFSIFNADMVERASLLSGGFSPEYGGRVSSVLTVESDPGESELHGDAGLSLLAARLALGGGLPDGAGDALGLSRGRWKVSARRSYFDQLLRPFLDFPYHLRDLQATFEGWTGGGDRITVTGYTGRDVLDLTTLDPDDFPLRINWDWGNDALGVRWTRPRDGGGTARASASYSRFSSGLAFPDFRGSTFRSAISQLRLRGRLEGRPRPLLAVTGGAGVDSYAFDNLARSGGTEFASGRGTGLQLHGFVQGRWRVPDRWLVEGGVRGDVWLADPGGSKTVIQPRLSVKRFLAGGAWAIRASAGRYSQFLHSIRDEELPIGLDVWTLTGELAPAVISDQAQLGVEALPAPGWELSLEGYVRTFDGVIATNRADDPNDPFDDYLAGRGLSYGADLMVRRSRGATTGWIAVSWLRARRTFPDVSSGLEDPPERTYPPIFDRRVDVDLVLRRTFGDDVEVGLRWNVGTGLPYTRPLASYRYYASRLPFGGRLVWNREADADNDRGAYAVLLGPRNGARYPARHRLDVSARKTLEREWGTVVPYLNLINAYNRKNVLFYFYEYEEDPPVRTGVSMFPILPTVGVEVSF